MGQPGDDAWVPFRFAGWHSTSVSRRRNGQTAFGIRTDDYGGTSHHDSKKMSTYIATIRWQNTGLDFLNRCYSREHTIHVDGGAVVHGSPSPLIVPAPWSNASAVDPEEAFVASVASCHMLWFLHVAVDAGFEAASYKDQAVGEMTKNMQGKQWISRVSLHPDIQWLGEKHPTANEVEHLHRQAHDECFIANSIKTKITICKP